MRSKAVERVLVKEMFKCLLKTYRNIINASVWGFVLTSSVGAHVEPCGVPNPVTHKCHL